MLGFLTRSRCWPISLDLGSDCIRMLQMRQIGSVIRVAACGQWQYPEGLTDAKQRDEMAVMAVREMLRTGGFSGRRVITGLACEDLHTKSVRMPHMEDAELAKAVTWEARERFSIDVQPDQLAFLNAGSVRQGAEARDEIILLVAGADTIQRRLELLQEMGLQPEHIDAEPIALFRTVERYLRRRSDEQAVSVVIDIGRRATRVVVARGRQIVFIKSIDIGGRKLAEALAKQLNISCQEVAELRSRASRAAPAAVKAGSLPTPEGDRGAVSWTIRDAIRGEIESLGHEIALCLRYCAVTFRGLRPERAVLTGGGAQDTAIVELLTEHLGVPCVVGQPLKGIDVSGANLGADRRASLAEWSVCAGLAGRHAEMPNVAPDQETEHEQEHRLSA